METELEHIQKSFDRDFAKVNNLQQLEEIRIKYFGKSGLLSQANKKLHNISQKRRPVIGKIINQIRHDINKLLSNKKQLIESAILEQNLKKDTIDVTLPGNVNALGTIHPITKTIAEITNFFQKYNFAIVQGPEVEDEWYNFTSLNMPDNHPARTMHDTFYTVDKRVLRTHTSSVQVRAMENCHPPIRIIAPGRVFRCDSDQTHTPMFHQIEGLLIEKNANFAQMKTLLVEMLHHFFSDLNIEIRFRPSYFPFTEPSAEVDIKVLNHKNSKWLEVLGSGMVHPNVLANMKIDANKYQGFAFGLGVERLSLLKYNLKDIRTFFENDIRFLKQFKV